MVNNNGDIYYYCGFLVPDSDHHIDSVLREDAKIVCLQFQLGERGDLVGTRFKFFDSDAWDQEYLSDGFERGVFVRSFLEDKLDKLLKE